MATVVRVKRRLDDAPANSLVFVCKRPRVDDGTPTFENVQNVFKFAGTIADKNSAVGQCVKDAIRKTKIERETMQYRPSTVESRTKQHINRAVDARYKITTKKRGADLDCLNSILDDVDEKDATPDDIDVQKKHKAVPAALDSADAIKKNFYLYDVEQLEGGVKDCASMSVEECKRCLHWRTYGGKPGEEPPHIPQKPSAGNVIQCNGIPLIREKCNLPETSPSGLETYVYDLYYKNSLPELDFQTLDELLNIEAYKDEYSYNFDHDSHSDADDDEDDENAENYYRNDYPDEDPDYFQRRNRNYFNTDNEDFREGGGFDDSENDGEDRATYLAKAMKSLDVMDGIDGLGE